MRISFWYTKEAEDDLEVDSKVAEFHSDFVPLVGDNINFEHPQTLEEDIAKDLYANVREYGELVVVERNLVVEYNEELDRPELTARLTVEHFYRID